jgi:LCP family protein required for cell wall assembly
VVIPVILVLLAWSRVPRVEFDPAAARRELAALSTSTSLEAVDAVPAGEAETTEVTTTAVVNAPGPSTTIPRMGPAETEEYPPPPPVPESAPVPDGDHQAILIIGSDRLIGGTRRADVIILVLIPADGSRMMLVSLPRDLYLENPCGGGRARINGALNGCGGVSGPNLLAVAVEDFTGIPVDHFVMFDYDGFAEVVDVAGGIEVCVDHPTFDTHTTPDLDLPAGCSTLRGKMALAWVRSRKTRQIVDGVEQAVPGVGDHTRQARQRDVVLQMLEKLSGFSGPGDIVSLANAAAGAFTLDSGLSLTGAVGIAWDLRGRGGSARSPRIAVSSYTTEAGAWVLVPTEPFSETIG